MWLEIFDSKDQSRVVALNKKRLSLGSSDTCDIFIDNPSVSRKHLLISMESGACFVMDMGSTNGTFLNDARLEHGRKTEMTTFFPLRLGNDVLVTLHEKEPNIYADKSEHDTKSFVLDDFADDEDSDVEEIDLFDDMEKELKEIEKSSTVSKLRPQVQLQADANTGHDHTRIISLKDLTQTKTETLVKKKQQVYTKKKIPPKKAKSRFSAADLFGIIAVFVLVYFSYEKFFTEPEVVVAPDPLQERIEERRRVTETSKKEEVIPEGELFPKASIFNLQDQVKCTTPEEKVFCQAFKEAQGEGFGAIQVGTKIVVLLDSFAIMNEARELLKSYSHQPEPIDIQKTAAALFIHKYIPNSFGLDMFKDVTLTFAFYHRVDPNAQEIVPEVAESVEVNPEVSPEEIVPVEELPKVDYSLFKPELSFVMAIKGSKLSELKPLIQDAAIMNIGKIGSLAFSFADNYLVIY